MWRLCAQLEELNRRACPRAGRPAGAPSAPARTCRRGSGEGRAGRKADRGLDARLETQPVTRHSPCGEPADRARTERPPRAEARSGERKAERTQVGERRQREPGGASSFTHLHLHTEFSMLDARPASARWWRRGGDGQRRSPSPTTATCRRPRLLQGVRAQGITPIIRDRGVHGRREPLGATGRRGGRRHRRRRRRWREALLPPDPAVRERRGLRNLIEAVERGVPRGVLLQAPARLGCFERHHHGVIATTAASVRRAAGALEGDVREGTARGRGCRTSSGATTSSSSPGPRARGAAPHNRSSEIARGSTRAARDNDSPHPSRKTMSPTTRCSASTTRRWTTPSASSSTARSTTSSPREMRRSSSTGRRRATTRCGSRSVQRRIEFGKPELRRSAARSLRHRRRVPRQLTRWAPSGATEYRARRRAGSRRLRARCHRRHGVSRVLPRRLGPHPPRTREGHSGGPRARERGGMLRRVLPGHRRLDPIRTTSWFRALLNPGRKQMPDIDMDFDFALPGEMIRYATEKYGWDHVAQIVSSPRSRPGGGAMRHASSLPVTRRRPHREGDAA